MDDDPAKIALAMRIARRTKSIVYQNIVFALAIKRPACCWVLWVSPICGRPSSPMSVSWSSLS